MKHLRLKITLALSLAFVGNIVSQTYTRYWVAFTDKNGSPYSVSNPQQYLSLRAINRRVNQNISITNEDIPVNTNYIQQVESKGAQVMCRSRWLNGVVVRLTDPSQLDSINTLSFVQSTKPLARVRSTKKYIPTAQTIALDNKKTTVNQSDRFNYGLSQGQIYLLNGQCLHNQGYDGTGMQIAVIDDGFIESPYMSVFDSLWHNHQVIASHDFFNDSDTLAYTEGGHGSDVLSCMASNLSGQMIGTAPYAKFYLLRSELDSTEKIIEEYQWVAAIEYADSAGADVVNSSLGYTEFDDASMNHTWADLNGRISVASISATMAARRGMVVCLAAGNEGNSAWQKISVPADADSILAVGATDASGHYANFSSVGNTADHRIKPDVSAQGANTIICYTSNNIGAGSGTSFASPTMAGMVACLWQGNPTKTNMEVISAIKQSASQYTTPDSLLGYGIPDFCVADQILKNIQGIELFNSQPHFKIYPNPASTILNIVVNSNEIESAKVYDVLGNTINIPLSPFKGGIATLDISTLPSGVYFIRFGTTTQKFIKQ